ncbi:MAG: GAF domain-containing protein [Rudaea sp.]|nr:GAF domain-containing protein [Rudaea sp.]
MPARFTAYPPDGPALIRLLQDDVSYRIGRAHDCELCVEHFSISRFHAELRGSQSGWSLSDIGSKNGLRVDGHMTEHISMNKATWFAVGDVYCWLELIDAAAVAMFRAHDERRRSISRSLSSRLLSSLGTATLLPQTLDVVLELTGLERGFVLYAAAGEPLRVRASRGLANEEIAQQGFSGSVTAVDRALAEHQSVVCCDTNDSPWLGVRPSVRLGGIRALVCVPLRVQGNAVGIVYADSRKPGPPITELDLELITNVADHAATALAASQLHGDVAEFLQAAANAGLQAPLWDDIRTKKSG